LHFVCRNGCTQYDEQYASILLKYKADINARARGLTPLMLACKSQSVALAKLLLDAGADPHLKDLNGCPTIAYAQAPRPHKGLLTLLQHHGAQLCPPEILKDLRLTPTGTDTPKSDFQNPFLTAPTPPSPETVRAAIKLWLEDRPKLSATARFADPTKLLSADDEPATGENGEEVSIISGDYAGHIGMCLWRDICEPGFIWVMPSGSEEDWFANQGAQLVPLSSLTHRSAGSFAIPAAGWLAWSK